MEIPEAKTVSESAIHEQTYKIFANDLNANDTAFGGLIMSILDRVTAVVAERHSQRICVTASVDSMHFQAPAKKGDILLISSAINRAWNTSMEIGVKVLAENFRTGERKHVITAYFTFVALDENNKPVKVPQVIPETDIEKRRYFEADIRRENRRKEKEFYKKNRSLNSES